MTFELKGRIKRIMDRQDFPSGFYKRDFVVTTEDQYPQDIKFSALKDKAEILEKAGVSEGAAVSVKFDISGREYNSNFYVDLKAWAIEVIEGSAPGVPVEQGENAKGETTQDPMPAVESAGKMPTTSEEEDDLPF